MSEVFISYSRKNKEFVTRLHAALEEQGRETWVDWEGIPLSAEWLQEIYDAIDAAHTFLFVISPQSIASKTCRLEIAYALSRKKRILPVMVQPVSPDAMPAELSAIQYILPVRHIYSTTSH